MPVCPVRLDAQASGLSIESIQLTIAEFDVPDRFVSIVRGGSPETKRTNTCVVVVYLCVRMVTLGDV
jgi:hypothetical protein